MGTPLKTDISKLLEDIEWGIPSSPRPQNAAWIIDAYSFIQTLKPLHKETGCTLLTVVKPSNFSEIALSIMSSLCNISCPQPDRIDFVVDTYSTTSIKNIERQRRSKNQGRRVKISTGTQKAPPDWNNYMSNIDNKNDLPEFLLSQWSQDPKCAELLKDSTLFVTHGTKCHQIQNGPNSFHTSEVTMLHYMAEEADTRLILHAKHAAETGSNSVVIRSSDTDVVVLAVYFQWEIDTELFLQGKYSKSKWKFLDIGSISKKLGIVLSKALLGFHAFSGCDTVSSFSGKGKKTFFKVLKSSEVFTNAMTHLGDKLDIEEKLLRDCERGLCQVYGFDTHNINDVRYDMLSKGAESHQIPPTKDALRLHILRANYQAYIWKHALNGHFIAPSPHGHGWLVKDFKISILWMRKDPAPKALLEFLHCKTCKKCDTYRCLCKKSGFQCSDICGCSALHCENSQDTGRFLVQQNSEDDDLEFSCHK